MKPSCQSYVLSPAFHYFFLNTYILAEIQLISSTQLQKGCFVTLLKIRKEKEGIIVLRFVQILSLATKRITENQPLRDRLKIYRWKLVNILNRNGDSLMTNIRKLRLILHEFNRNNQIKRYFLLVLCQCPFQCENPVKVLINRSFLRSINNTRNEMQPHEVIIPRPSKETQPSYRYIDFIGHLLQKIRSARSLPTCEVTRDRV